MAKNLMIQGTMSNVGKSVLTAGILRVLHQDGYRVAPYKSQNMALNSYITIDGLEMGRAQVMQAEAAGIIPDVRMNPVLLKPTSDVGSQVILLGKVSETMHAAEYFRKKKELIPVILNAYHALEKENDLIVIEGAGSPAEINLKQNDIVNMGLAEMVDAPVLLVGDIDRGGVFAQLYGTVSLLEELEKKRVKGFIMNKFRGDKSLLANGVDMLYDRCKIKTLGIIPYMDLHLDEEDSLAESLRRNISPEKIDIAVILLPHISNFTDFRPLDNLSDISLRYVSEVSRLGNPDLIILPGTKNTMYDLLWLKKNGFYEKILDRFQKNASVILGICGGFQMLGEYLEDPDGVEEGGIERGLGILPIRTYFRKTKVTTRVKGSVLPRSGFFAALNGCDFGGYEIHMGRTERIADDLADCQVQSFARLYHENEQHESVLDGFCKDNCLGTYVHGLFEEGTFGLSLLQLLFDRKGIVWKGKPSMDYHRLKEREYDRLADLIRNNVDMDEIYRIIG